MGICFSSELSERGEVDFDFCFSFVFEESFLAQELVVSFLSFMMDRFEGFFRLEPWFELLQGFLPGLGRGGRTHFLEVEIVGTKAVRDVGGGAGGGFERDTDEGEGEEEEEDKEE